MAESPAAKQHFLLVLHDVAPETWSDYRDFVARIHGFYAGSPAEKLAAEDEARQYVRREYSWPKTADQYLDLFAGKP